MLGHVIEAAEPEQSQEEGGQMGKATDQVGILEMAAGCAALQCTGGKVRSVLKRVFTKKMGIGLRVSEPQSLGASEPRSLGVQMRISGSPN